jgi:outer membrane assembly lipoprotein YfgL
MNRTFAAALLALLLAACAGGPEKPKPVPLEPLAAQIGVRQVWSARVEATAAPVAVTRPAAAFAVAARDGGVLALSADTGRELWRADAGGRNASGAGSDGRWAAVVTRDNELVVFDAGRELWRSRLIARVATPPLVAGERVFVMGVDRVVHAFDVTDGRKLWTLQRPGDALTLSQAAVVAPFKDSLLVGQGARLAAVDPRAGSVRWELPFATPRGTNEVERLADLVGPLARQGNVVCARAFQSAVSCADAERGSLLWTRPAGGTSNVAADGERVYGVDASGRITAWRAASGDVAWTSEKLLYRQLSGPAVLGRAVVFGDLEGWLHFFDRDTGTPLLRLPTDGSAIVLPPVVAGGTLLVATRSGSLLAFRAE